MNIWGRDAKPFGAMYGFTLTQFEALEFIGAQGVLEVLQTAKNARQAISIETPALRLQGRRLNSAETTQFVSVWNAVDGDEQDRCHIPRHVIATQTNENFDWVCAICFECNNASIAGSAATAKLRKMLSLTDNEPLKTFTACVSSIINNNVSRHYARFF